MDRLFGQIPRPNPEAASDVADAARDVERLLNDIDPDPEPVNIPDEERFPRAGVDIPNVSESDEVVEDFGSSSLPTGEGQGEERHDGVTGGVVDGGIEYLAFYKSFRDVLRRPAVNRWGIFFIKKRCISLAGDMSIGTGVSFHGCLDALATFLYVHELYHYRFDAHCLQMEATGGFPVYSPYRRQVAHLSMHDWHEESVANFYALKALQTNRTSPYSQPVCDFLWDLVAHSPGAYSGGVDRSQTPRKDEMAQQAGSAFVKRGPHALKNLVISTARLGTNLTRPREPKLSSLLNLNACPVYWIDWKKSGTSIVTPFAVPVAEINNDFIRRYLAGVPDHHSDHSYYRIDNGQKVKLPNPHDPDLKRWEFHNIIAKAGMTSAQFYKERERTKRWRKGVPRSPVLQPRFPQKPASN